MSNPSLNLSREAAAAIAAPLLRCSLDLDAALHVLRERASREDFETARTIVGTTLGEIYLAAFRPIFEAHPDLKPEGFP